MSLWLNTQRRLDGNSSAGLKTHRFPCLPGYEEVFRVLVFGKDALSISLTKDGHHGYQYHMSICQFSNNAMMRVCDDGLNVICKSFFTDWKEIPNPGAMVEVRHVVGNYLEEE